MKSNLIDLQSLAEKSEDIEKKKKKVKPIVPSIVSIEQFNRLQATFMKMNISDPLYESYKVAIERGVRKSSVTKPRNKNRQSMIAESRKINRGAKGRTKK